MLADPALAEGNPLRLQFRCPQCDTNRTDFAATSKDNSQPRVRQSVGLWALASAPHAPAMFVVTEEDEAAIRAVYEQRGEFAAAVELRRRNGGLHGRASTAAAVHCNAATS